MTPDQDVGRLDARDRRFRDELRARLLAEASREHQAQEQEREIPVAFEYRTTLGGRRRRGAGRAQRLATLVQAAALLLIVAGLLVVQHPAFQPPWQERALSPREMVGRALAALEVPRGMVAHRVASDTSYFGNGEAYVVLAPELKFPFGTAVQSLPAGKGQLVVGFDAPSSRAYGDPYATTVSVRGTGFSPNTQVQITFNAPYAADGAPSVAVGTGPSSPCRKDGASCTVVARTDGAGRLREASAPASGSIAVRLESWQRERALPAGSYQARVDTSTAKGVLRTRLVIGRGMIYRYDAAARDYSTAPLFLQGDASHAPEQFTPENEMRNTLLDALRAGSGLRALPQNRLDGVPVRVLSYTPDIQGMDLRRVFYLDVTNYHLRGWDEFHVRTRGVGMLMHRVRLTKDEMIAPNRLPHGTFSGTPPDGTSYSGDGSPSCITLPLASTQDGFEAPLLVLQGTPGGLRLHGVTAGATGAGELDLTSLYGPDAVGDGRYLQVERFRDTSSGGFGATTPGAASEWRDLRVAGARVRALYDRTGASSPDALADLTLTYQDAGSTVRLLGHGLGERAFFRAVAALRDGRSHPALVRALDAELAARGGGTGCHA